MAGIKSEKASNGQEAVEIYKRRENGFFDIILMDIRMPEMDGYEACRQIRGAGRRDSLTIPIVAMTANAFSEDIELAGKSGMNAHLAKPVDAGADDIFIKRSAGRGEERLRLFLLLSYCRKRFVRSNKDTFKISCNKTAVELSYRKRRRYEQQRI